MVIFKQYGEMRTGTNYLKYILLNNFKDIRLYVDEFGWKHGFFDPPPTRGGHNRRNNHKPEAFNLKSHEEWVDSAISGEENTERRKLIKNDLIIKKLTYLISYKKFADWIYSIKNWSFNGVDIESLDLEALGDRYLFKYTQWSSLFPEAEIIFFNNLIEEEGAKKILHDLEVKFNLEKLHGDYILQKMKINANSRVTDTEFNKYIFTNRTYLSSMSEDFRQKLLEKEKKIESILPAKFSLLQ